MEGLSEAGLALGAPAKKEAQSRLCVLCSAIEVDLDRVHQALREELPEQPEFLDLGLIELEAPAGLARAGWMATELSPATELSLHLRALTGAFARALRDAVVGIYFDPTEDSALALLHGPGSLPRFTEGPLTHVLKQVARWLESDARELIDYFQATERPEDLYAPVDLSSVEPPAVEQDADDRYVQQKLRTARELMEQYLARRK